MKVLYDYPSFIPEYGGVPRYLCEVIKELHGDVEIELSVLYSDNVYRKQLTFLKNRRSFTRLKFRGRARVEGAINLAYSSWKILSNHYDLFHATYNNTFDFGISNASYFRFVRKPFVVTIHDMIYEHAPHREQYARNIESKRRLIYGADHIIAVSENTKKEILKFYPVDPQKITVIYHGTSGPIPAASPRNEWGKYLLYVGRRSPYKNFPLFVRAVAPLLGADRQLQLVCVTSPFTPEEDRLFSDLGIAGQVRAVGVPDDALNALYQHALAFVFPSLDEGFGIPILEAYQNNCPVCLSDASCFPEIAGNAAEYFDPRDEVSIREAVSKVIGDPGRATELRRLGRERVTLFSWKTAARQTLEVYRRVQSSKKKVHES